MTVQFSERKGVPVPSVREGKIPFLTCLQTSTILFLTLPLSPATQNMISTPEFQTMQPDVLIINVARGGIIDEDAAVQALKDRSIGGLATDVFVEEPATLENSVLVRAANEWADAERAGGEMASLNGRLVLSPHIAWWARSSIEKLQTTVGANIEAWARSEPTNIVP
jgi:lactate dehydrogenase-like 2-hydroxyacid dehydrogenase